uniref:Uncharacterized protein n=1 Tax=Aegilops tauschii subsp. strangulata TaxID=200361 RepID=A0A452YEQ2_AEGTS
MIDGTSCAPLPRAADPWQQQRGEQRQRLPPSTSSSTVFSIKIVSSNKISSVSYFLCRIVHLHIHPYSVCLWLCNITLS